MKSLLDVFELIALLFAAWMIAESIVVMLSDMI